MSSGIKTKFSGSCGGFTIVEVLIVLAVTSLMFISIIALVNGKQQSAEFNAAINSVQSQLQQVINETGSGYFPSTALGCSLSGPGGSSSGPLGITSTPSTQHPCVFLGKAIHFKQASASFEVYPIIASRDATLSDAGGQLYTARPTLVPADIAAAITTMPLQNGLTLNAMHYVNAATGASQSIGSLAFVQSFGKTAFHNTAGSGGSQSLNLVAPTSKYGSSATSDRSQEIGKLNMGFNASDGYVSSSQDNAASQTSVQLCFTSGTTDQSGRITVGDSQNGLAVALKIFNGDGCGA